MYAIHRELKLNNKEVSLMRGLAGFKRFVYNYGLELITSSWEDKNLSGNDAKRLDDIKKVFTSITMLKPEYAWMKKYPSTVYQSAFLDLKKLSPGGVVVSLTSRKRKPKRKEIHLLFIKHLGFIQIKVSLLCHLLIEL